MKTKTIISCAVTGGADTLAKHPGVPVTPEQIANAAIEARNAGATIAHIHVRDPKTGKASQSVDYYRDVVERIRASGCDILINLTTGPGSRFVPSDDDPKVGGPGTTMTPPLDRVRHVVELLPDICSLDVGSMNFGETGFVNTPAHLRTMAEAIAKTGVKPELEVFEPGHVMLARRMVEDGRIAKPPLFQICLGIPWGTPATPESMLYMRNLLPPGAIWAGFGISRMEFPMVAQAVILGGHVRVGMEDNLYIDHGVLTPGNGALVERAVSIVRLLGAEPASPADARAMLGLQSAEVVR
ncbi:MAG TPA: 3-keto-5-aminohexanoate cleavage protein [Casimicrobiaceae bacterium]|nr:3-keto-5-aminohexanoate cleavage protein [Casimicrobiaceae bacterium]